MNGFNVPVDMSCAYTQHMFGDMGAYPRHIETHGVVMNNNVVNAVSLQSPI